jgi:hypothetical protein
LAAFLFFFFFFFGSPSSVVSSSFSAGLFNHPLFFNLQISIYNVASEEKRKERSRKRE